MTQIKTSPINPTTLAVAGITFQHPPSPPRSPPPNEDKSDSSDDEQALRTVNADDYREYERWYAEDNLGEDVEMLAKTLTDEEVDSIIMLAIRQFGTVSLAFIPERAGRWGKLRIPDGGDCIRCAAVFDPLSVYGKRDSSFVRYEFQKDANEDYPDLDPEMVDVYAYGRLDFIIALTLPASKKFKLKEPELHILAHVTEAQGAEGNAAKEFVSFSKFGRSIILDVTSVKNLVGRLETTGVKASGEWYIIDRNLDECETVFHPPEHEYEGGGDDQ